jgi:hypothetical protein
MEMVNATSDNSPLTCGIRRRRFETQNDRSLMSFVVHNSPRDRVTNEQTPRMAKFVDGLIEFAKRLFINLE